MDGNYDLINHLSKFVGETVTIFTTSGGQSGDGFTGVLICVNNVYVRLVTQIGPAPGCALGNCCTGFAPGNIGDVGGNGVYDGDPNCYGRRNCGVYTVGAVADIPVFRIASFVHNDV